MFKKILNFLALSALISLVSVLIFYLLIDVNFLNLKVKIYENFPNIELRKYIFNKKSKIEHFKNDYNVKFLPYTQFEKLNYIKKKIIFENDLILKSNHSDNSIAYKRYNSFFIDFFDDKLLLTDHSGNIYYIDKSELFSNKKELKAKNIKSDFKATRVFDAFIYSNKLFVSYISEKDGCNTINVSNTEVNFKMLEFKNFFNPEICNNSGSPGKIQYFKKGAEEGILLSTSEGIHDKPGLNTQDPNSLFGKILFIPFDKEKNFEVYSIGHRVIQGLNVNNNIVISSEHGPRGGDEINRIFYKKNYGWPVVSLGERYDFKYGNDLLTYKKDHKKNNFIDPLFSFIPSIGISEIINLPKTFSIYYENHYLASSLNGRSLYFIRFDQDFKKTISTEKVYISNRIRDMKFSLENNSIVLALEELGEIGILSNN